MNERAVVAGGAIPADSEVDGAPAIRVRGYWQSVFHRLGYDWVTLAFGVVVLAIVIVAIAARSSRRSTRTSRALSAGSSRSAGAAIPGAPTNWAGT